MSVRAESRGPDLDVYIYDTIIEDSWRYGNEVSGASFRDAVAENPAAKQMNLYINSGGGDVYEAQAIFSQVNRFKGKVVAHIDGLAASAATLIAMGADEVIMSEGSWFMIHNAWTVVAGEASELREYADHLERTSEMIGAAYVAKTGKDPEEIKSMMDAETWMTAEEALGHGFIDTITAAKRVAASAFIGHLSDVPEAVKSIALGTQEPATGEQPMAKNAPEAPDNTADVPTAVAATIEQIEAACPNASADFLLAQVKAGSTIEAAQAAHMEHITKALADAKAELATIRSESEKAIKEAVARAEKAQADLKNVELGASPEDAPNATPEGAKSRASSLSDCRPSA